MKDFCPFCHPEKDPDQRIIFENEHCYYLQHSRHQDVLEGSGVIVPKRHQKDAYALSREEWDATYELLQRAKKYLEETYAPDGYTLGWNVGEVSNQSIFHSHFHVIPRFDDEPFARRGVRYWLKSEENRRPQKARASR